MSETVVPPTDDNAGMNPLRRAREAKGVALNEAARVTRIATGYLRALEEGQFDKLPSDAHARGFLKAYGHFLGCSEDEMRDLYQRFDSPHQHSCENKEQRSSPVFPFSAKWSGMRCGRIAAAVCTVFVVAVIYFVSSGTRKDQRAAQPLQVQPPNSRETASKAPVTEDPPPERRPPVTEQKTGIIPFNHHAKTENGVILRLKALEDSSLDVTIDDTISQHYDLKAGDLIEWKAERGFSLDLDNGGGVEAVFDGKHLEPFGAKGRPAHVVLKVDDDKGEAPP